MKERKGWEKKWRFTGATFYGLLLLMTVLSKSLFALVSRNLMSLSLFSARHNACFLMN